MICRPVYGRRRAAGHGESMAPGPAVRDCHSGVAATEVAEATAVVNHLRRSRCPSRNTAAQRAHADPLTPESVTASPSPWRMHRAGLASESLKAADQSACAACRWVGRAVRHIGEWRPCCAAEGLSALNKYRPARSL